MAAAAFMKEISKTAFLTFVLIILITLVMVIAAFMKEVSKTAFLASILIIFFRR